MKMSLLEMLIYLQVAVTGTALTYCAIKEIRGKISRARSKRRVLELYNNIPQQFESHENFYKSLEEGNEKANQYMGNLLGSMAVSPDYALTDPELRQVTDVIIKYGQRLSKKGQTQG